MTEERETVISSLSITFRSLKNGILQYDEFFENGFFSLEDSKANLSSSRRSPGIRVASESFQSLPVLSLLVLSLRADKQLKRFPHTRQALNTQHFSSIHFLLVNFWSSINNEAEGEQLLLRLGTYCSGPAAPTRRRAAAGYSMTAHQCPRFLTAGVQAGQPAW